MSYEYCAEVFQKLHEHGEARKLWATEAEMDSPIDLRAKAPKTNRSITLPNLMGDCRLVM